MLALRHVAPKPVRAVSSTPTRSVAARAAPQSRVAAIRARPAQKLATPKRYFASKGDPKQPAVPESDEDMKKVWDDIEKLDDLYDPRTDADVPESEYGEHDHPFEDFINNVSGVDRLPPRERQEEEDDDANDPDHPQPIRRPPSVEAIAGAAASPDVVVAASVVSTGKQKTEARKQMESLSALSRQKIGSLTLPGELAGRIAASVRD